MADLRSPSPDILAEDEGRKLIAVASVFIPILILVVALRFFAMYIKRRPWGVDDGLVVLSLVWQLGASTLAMCFVRYGGVGRHFAYFEQYDPETIVTYYKYVAVLTFYYSSGVAFPKLAILALYLRLFPFHLYRIAVYVIGSIVIANAIACVLTAAFICRPFAYYWDKTIPGGYCADQAAFDRWASMANIITDVVMLVLPAHIVWNLKASVKIKIGLAVTFLMGSFGLAASIVRFVMFGMTSVVVDGTWSSVDLMTWTLVEPNVYLISACLPMCRPLYTLFSTKVKELSRSFSNLDPSKVPGVAVQISKSKSSPRDASAPNYSSQYADFVELFPAKTNNSTDNSTTHAVTSPTICLHHDSEYHSPRSVCCTSENNFV
ncbi:hypothetical protein N7534_006821 [Penicillium rubens]|nr:hypothetical protein N7534_006821 [Penicillium rubens]